MASFFETGHVFFFCCRKRIVEAVLSVLDYGDTIYRIAAPSILQRLDAVYHSALRFVTGDSYDTHHCVLYANAGLSSLNERRERHLFIYLFIFKAIIGKLPPYISSLLEWNSNPYLTRSGHLLLLKIPQAQTQLGKSTFSFSAPTSWNALQKTLKFSSLPSYGQFKALVLHIPTSVCTCFND